MPAPFIRAERRPRPNDNDKSSLTADVALGGVMVWCGAKWRVCAQFDVQCRAAPQQIMRKRQDVVR